MSTPITKDVVAKVDKIKPLLTEYYALIKQRNNLEIKTSSVPPKAKATVSFLDKADLTFVLNEAEVVDDSHPYDMLVEFMLDYFDLKIAELKEKIEAEGYQF